MATPTTELWYLDVLTTLGNISTANGYKTNVNTVHTYVLDWCDSDFESYDVCAVKLQSSYQETSFGQLKAITNMRVQGIVRGNASETAKRQALEDFVDDVIAALHKDPFAPRQQGNAVKLSLVSTQHDAAIRDHRNHTGIGGMFVTDWSVTHFRTTDKS